VQGVNADWILPALVEVVLTETILSAAWVGWYYSYGPVVFRRVFPSASGRGAATPGSLPRVFGHSFLPSLLTRRLGEGQFAVRERFFELRVVSYTPIMHGLAEFDSSSGRVVVTGRANWSSLAFIALFASFSVQAGVHLVLLAPLTLLVAVIYLVQAHRYSQLGRRAASTWSSDGTV